VPEREDSGPVATSRLVQKCPSYLEAQTMSQLLTQEPLRVQTREFLAGLGHSPGEVARYLEALGVRGTRNNSECCVVAELLAAIVACEPEVRGVRVFRRFAVVRRKGPFWFSLVRLPKAVRTFVLAFDAGAYPNLVRQTGPVRRAAALDDGQLGEWGRRAF
jgi:hypothetical protein